MLPGRQDLVGELELRELPLIDLIQVLIGLELLAELIHERPALGHSVFLPLHPAGLRVRATSKSDCRIASVRFTKACSSTILRPG
jgi:hypothetical protein